LWQSSASYEMFWMGSAWTDAVHGGQARGMFFFSDADSVDDAFKSVKNYFEGGLKLKKVEFFNRRFVEKLNALDEDKLAILLKERLALGTIFQPSSTDITKEVGKS
jgi:hypothetical protein